MSTSFKRSSPSGLYRAATAFGLLVGAAAWANPSVASALAAEKVIEVESQHGSDAVMVTKVTFGNSEVQCGLIVSPTEVQPVTPIEAGDDWLQNLTIYLLNRTNKTIVFGQIALAFPETGDGSPQHPQAVYILTLGRLPESVAFSGTGQPLRQDPGRQPIWFARGQTLRIRVGDYTEQIRTYVDGVRASGTPSFTALTKCIIRRSSFVFDDGMRWDGEYSLPDPEHRGKWKRIEGDYFPHDGDRYPPWPPNYHK
ncbi:MAG: hypothetical protein ABSH00_15665 [Bryobacteraceae bacterium]|jgi:hypothetical protein